MMEGIRGMHLVIFEVSLLAPALVEVVVDSGATPEPCMVPVLAPPARKRFGATQLKLLKAVEVCTWSCMNSLSTPAFVELVVDPSAISGPCVVPVLAPPGRNVSGRRS